MKSTFNLLAYCIGYFTWSFISTRQVILATSYAHYHNVTNELSFPTLGIDSLTISSNFIVIFSYILAGYVIDIQRIGLYCISIGMIGLTIGSWTWYIAKENFYIVFFANVIYSIMGPFISACILALANRCFPKNRHVIVIGIGTLSGILGNAASFIVGPLYISDEKRYVDYTLPSCQLNNVTMIDNDECYKDAFDAFCCYTRANIEGYNIMLAIFTTVSCIICIACTSNPVMDEITKPMIATEISESTEKKEWSYWTLLKNRRFMQLNVGDLLLASGPEVLVSTISRILPHSVAGNETLITAVAIGLSIPSSIAISMYIDRYHYYFSTTFSAYTICILLWMVGSIAYMMDVGVLMMVCIMIAIVCYIVWQVSGYALKMVYTKNENEGKVASIDRIVVNVSSFLFVSILPPERLGVERTLWVLWGIMCCGFICIGFIRDKYTYH